MNVSESILLTIGLIGYAAITIFIIWLIVKKKKKKW
jgi:LPXTG-motif cell wall-anchored protein